MNKVRVFLILMAMFSMQSVFAQDQGMMPSDAAEGKPCATIAKACLDAGFVRMATQGKQFWHDCMKPLILGQTVSGVTVDPSVVQTCRANKIDQLKKELDEFQKAS